MDMVISDDERIERQVEFTRRLSVLVSNENNDEKRMSRVIEQISDWYWDIFTPKRNTKTEEEIKDESISYLGALRF